MPDYHDSDSAFNDLYSQYVDVASFLWVLRGVVLARPDYTVGDLQTLEQRINFHLDGIMTSMEGGWAACESALAIGEAGEIFTAMVIAIHSHDTANIRTAVEAGLENTAASKGLISALGWLPATHVDAWIGRFLNGKTMEHKLLGVAACSVRRKDPGDSLTSILSRQDCLSFPDLHARALRLVGELRRQDLMPAVRAGLQSDNDDVKFWAVWSAILLGDKKASEHLQAYIFKAGPHQLRAILLAFRILPVEQARDWISQMASDSALERETIIATGVLGDPHAVNWLISKMHTPEFARVAAESFCYITGIDLASQQATLHPGSDLIQAAEVDENDEGVKLDDDEYLAWPDVKKIAVLWQQYGQNFIVGQRYFLGQPISTMRLKHTIQSGLQCQRHAAALELALIDSQSQFINTKERVSF